MAKGDITKVIENDKIEIVATWAIQVRQATKIMEEQEDGSKKEISRSFFRHVVEPFWSVKGEDGGSGFDMIAIQVVYKMNLS